MNTHIELLLPKAFFGPKYIKYCSAAGLRRTRWGSLQRFPRPFSCVRLREGREGRQGEGKGKGKECGRGGEREEGDGKGRKRRGEGEGKKGNGERSC